jgi:S1-C subfamily serine protease
MRVRSWLCVILALSLAVLPGLQALGANADEPAKGKAEGKKDEAKAKKDEEAKGKIPEEQRKKIRENKIKFGVVVIEVTADGPATKGHEKAGGGGDTILLEEGDIITHVDGKEVKSAADYYKLMSGKDEKKITVIDINTGKSVSDYFTPDDGKLGVVFEVIAPEVG